MKTKLLKRLRKKVKDHVWIQYEAGYFRIYRKDDKYHASRTGGVKRFEVAIRDLADCRRVMILDWVSDMKEKKINKEIRDL